MVEHPGGQPDGGVQQGVADCLRPGRLLQEVAEAVGGEGADGGLRRAFPVGLGRQVLCGSRVTEFTAASTTGLYDIAGGRWVTELADELGIPTRVLPEVVPPGTDLGAVVGPLGDGPLAGTRVIAPAGHDTASAVVATPFPAPGALFISSGTWSLVGWRWPGPS